VGPGFFETLGLSILHGRSFTIQDQRSRANVVVVNETMANQLWPSENPVGQML